MSNCRVTQEWVTRIMEASKIEDMKIGEKTTLVSAMLPNSFVIVETSSCVDPENYDHEMGKKICLKRIEDKIWLLEGYVLQGGGGASIVEVAKTAHEVNRVYCEALGDHSQAAWNDAERWQRESCIKGVMFHLVNTDASPAASHESWMKEKEATGWKYGPVKDPEKKEHPCMVPYD